MKPSTTTLSRPKGTFIPSSKRNPCPICGDHKGKCRTVADSELILCMNVQEDMPGWNYIGQTTDDLWGKFLPSDLVNAPKTDTTDAPEAPTAIRPPRLVVSDARKDANYRAILTQISLSDRHLVDFQRRNLSDAEIKFVSTIARSMDNGYLIPFPNVDGELAGAQIRRDQAEGGRYRWYYIRYDWDLNNEFGEKPLAVWQLGFSLEKTEDNPLEGAEDREQGIENSPNPSSLTQTSNLKPQNYALTPWIIEGTGVKPIVASLRHGITAIGAAGGQHYLSPQTLAYTLGKLGNPQQVIFCPDAGDIRNPQVLRRIEHNIDLLEALGIQVAIAWWGQDQKDKPDIDEIPNLDQVRYLSPGQFWALVPEQEQAGEQHPFHSFAQWVAWATGQSGQSRPEPKGFGLKGIEDREQGTENSPPPYNLIPITYSLTDHSKLKTQIYSYAPGDRLSTWQYLTEQGFRHILDISGTGSGKSYDTGQIQPQDFGSTQVFYISTEHRNPTVETLKENWYDMEARHGGLAKETTADGEVRWRRIKVGQVPVTPANCSRSDLITELRSKTLDADQANLVCSTCPLYELCCNTEGSGFGFLKQRRTSLARERLRLHGLSLPPVESFEYKAIALVWDEASVGLLHRQDMRVNDQDILETMSWLLTKNALSTELQDMLLGLRELLADKSGLGRFGLNHAAILDALPPVSCTPEALASVFDPMEVFKPLNPTLHGVNLADLPTSQRKFYASKAGQTDQIPKLWLLPFLGILQNHYPGATLRIDHGGLILSLPSDRHAEITQAAKVNIYLDATLNREDLALALGISPEEIVVVCQEQPATPNLTVTQITDFGRMGRQRGMDQQRRLQALTLKIKEEPGITKVIDFKDQKQDGAHFVDGRGVNFFQNVTHLIIAGTPCPNLMDLQSSYSAMCKRFIPLEDEGFQAWVHRLIEGELIQEIGRLRAHRRPNEELHCYILNNFEFKTLTVHQAQSQEFTIEAAPKLERTCYRIEQAAGELVAQGIDLSQRALAKMVNMSRSRITEVIQTIYGSWEAFKQGWSVLLLDSFIAKPATSDPPEPDPDLEATAGVILQGLIQDPPEETPGTILALAELLGWKGLQRVVQGLSQDDRSRLMVNFVAPMSAALKPRAC